MTQEDGTVVRYASLDDVELRARQRYADLAVNPEVRDTFRKRAKLIKSLRTFLMIITSSKWKHLFCSRCMVVRRRVRS